MKESTAWLKIAKAFDEAEPACDGIFDVYLCAEEDGNGKSNGFEPANGICDALHDLCYREMITPYCRERMEASLALMAPPTNSSMYWWRIDTLEDNKERVLACCFLAAMTALEEKEDETE